MDDEDPTYFRTVGECIHLNPVEAGNGSSDFRERMMAYLEEQEGMVSRQDGIGEQKRDYSSHGASLALARGLKSYGLKASDLGSLSESDARKMILAGALKKHFSVSNSWISDQLAMGRRSTVTRAMKAYLTPTRKQKRERQKVVRILELLS